MLYTCPNLWCNPCSKCCAMDCLSTCFTHAQTCDVTRVQSTTQWTASVHTLHMPKPGLEEGGQDFFQRQRCAVRSVIHKKSEWTKACKVNGKKKLAGTQVLDRTWMWLKKFIPHSIKNRGNSVLNPRLWDYVYQFVYGHNKDLWETIWRSKTTFCVVVHISRTSYKNRKTSDCVVNHMVLDYANVWRHRASRRLPCFYAEIAIVEGFSVVSRAASWWFHPILPATSESIERSACHRARSTANSCWPEAWFCLASNMLERISIPACDLNMSRDWHHDIPFLCQVFCWHERNRVRCRWQDVPRVLARRRSFHHIIKL